MIKKIIVAVVIVLVILFLLPLAGFFVAPGITVSGLQGLVGKLYGSQTIGQVTANRRPSRVTIEPLVVAPGKKDTLSPVIGEAYKITRLKDDYQPVHVEFAYNPAELPAGIAEKDLKLFKWHEDGQQKFWQPIASAADPARHTVSADLTTFSILAVRAPLAYYLSAGEVAGLNKNLSNLEKNEPANTCGIFIIAEEELLEWNGADIMEAYLRPEAEQIELRDCAANPNSGVPVRTFAFVTEREINGRRVQYSVVAGTIWQTDDEKSAQLSGAVVDQNGQPLEEVMIKAEKVKYSAAQASTATDKDGKFTLDLHSGIYQITVDPAGGSGQHKNCSPANKKLKLHAFGDLIDKIQNNGTLQKQGPWQETFSLTCSEYYIDETVQLPVNSNVAGIVVKGTETATITGQLIKPTRGGYGWEGTWEIEHQVKAETKTSGVMSIMGGTIAMPSGTIKAEDHYKYQINLPRGAKAGDSFAIKGTRSGYQDTVSTAAGALVVSANGATTPFNLGATSSTETAGDTAINRTGRIVAVNGEDGLTIELFQMVANDPPKVNIKHMK
ncbi:MAG: carboxypeptidase-like regulatory domain-containing protein [Patescibacteria group bacterium]|jgi:hypothetical protein